MNRSPLILLLLVLNFSCNNLEIQEYHENGSIKSRYKRDIKNESGEKTYYSKDGGIIRKDYFLNNQLASSIYYFEGKDNLIQESWSYNDSTVLISKYDKNGEITKQGEALKNNFRFKIGKWVYSDHITKIDSIVEYVDVNNQSYVNQVWLRTSRGDTVYGRGNNFHISKKDTISVDEIARVRFTLMEPSLGFDSDMIIIIPKNDEDLNDDFSNFFKIERDTVYSLKNDGISRNGIPKDMPINHVAEFGLQYDNPGKRRIRGVLIEYYHNKSEVTNSANFSDIEEKKLFFNDYLFIKNGI